MLQVRIADPNITDAKRINYSDEDAFKGQRQDVPPRSTFTSKDRHPQWQIELGATTNKLKAKNQRMLRSAIITISRKYRSDRMFKRPRTKGTIFTDTMEGRDKSLDGNCYAQVFVNGHFFAAAHPMEKKSIARQGLREFIGNFLGYGPLVCTGSKEQT